MKPTKDKFILLFTPQPEKGGRRSIPLGLLAISTYLDKEGYDIRIYHSYDQKDYLAALDQIEKVIAVGITSMTGYQIHDGLQFAKLVRKQNRKIPIIWGGIHPTIMPCQTANHPLVDIVVKGSGEETFTELIHRLDRGKNYEDVPNITFKKDGNIIDNQTKSWKSINDHPPLPYHLLDEVIEKYIKKSGFAKRNLTYITSSGCPYRCSFCYLAANSMMGKWDAYPAVRVIKELKNLVDKYAIDGIEIRDSNFFANPQRVKDICQGLINEKIKLNFSTVNGRAEQLIKYDDKTWQLLKDAGIKEVLIGAESGDQEILDLINKKSSVKAILECEAIAKRFAINTVNSFMTSYPPPTDDKKDQRKFLIKEFKKTVLLVNEIFKLNRLANILLFFYTPYPGTPMYELAIKRGFREPADLEEWSKIDLSHKVTPWTDKKFKNRVYLLQKLFILKKITSREYINKQKSKKYKFFKLTGILYILNLLVTFRLKHNFYLIPIENLIIKI
jgi:radical SAM superfamily enzyme YgiQ (UPF0313 family)